MPRMKVLYGHDWNQSPVKPGDEYDATENEAQLVEALGWSERVELVEPVRQRRQYRSRAMTAQQ